MENNLNIKEYAKFEKEKFTSPIREEAPVIMTTLSSIFFHCIWSCRPTHKH